MTLHKTPIASRPLGRSFTSQMKTFPEIVEDISQRIVTIVFNSTLPYAKILADIGQTWENELSEK